MKGCAIADQCQRCQSTFDETQEAQNHESNGERRDNTSNKPTRKGYFWSLGEIVKRVRRLSRGDWCPQSLGDSSLNQTVLTEEGQVSLTGRYIRSLVQSPQLFFLLLVLL